MRLFVKAFYTNQRINASTIRLDATLVAGRNFIRNKLRKDTYVKKHQKIRQIKRSCFYGCAITHLFLFIHIQIYLFGSTSRCLYKSVKTLNIQKSHE